LAYEFHETPALRFGRLAHKAILEPQAWASWHVCTPSGIDRRTKSGKAAWAGFEREAAGREIVNAEELETIRQMQDACYAHPRARVLLERPGGVEVSAFAYHQTSGEHCKCRPDKACGDGIIADLKTCEDASPGAFSRSCAKYGYDVQAAFYPMVWTGAGEAFEAFVFVAVEKTPPYGVGVYQIDPQAVYAARCAIDDALLRLAECKISKSWPAYSGKVETLYMPKWHNLNKEAENGN